MFLPILPIQKTLMFLPIPRIPRIPLILKIPMSLMYH
jgi:hypothetical protein